ncbi:hypothetical protein CASFOL_031397 [Castilleja foliolosa]|uniref:Uncharacterized protein n=1 Tax=Castilleja foliolosa TaxID=1961234 RepID=A0ABD3C5Z8_9LAMI
MGCCLSSRDHRHHEMDSIGGAPPTSPPHILDVETVKEVLLETPVTAVPNADERIKGLMSPESREWKEGAGVPPPSAAIRGGPDPEGKLDDEEIVSEVSEMFSYSESYSNATATAAQDKKLDGDEDEDGVVNQRPLVRARRGGAGGRGRGRSGERVVSRRTAAASPEKRGQVAPIMRSVRGKSKAGQPRNVASEESVRQGGAGDVSRRRSESPAGRRNASEEKSAAAGSRDPPNDDVPEEEGESLENPVVSLECFIFL